MIPSVYTNETAVKARMEDRISEARQYQQARHAEMKDTAAPQIRGSGTRSFGWLRRLATSLVGGK
jgi:hypothetical protein